MVLLTKCGAELYNFTLTYDLYFELFFDQFCDDIYYILDGLVSEGGRIPTNNADFETVVRGLCYNLLLRKMNEYDYKEGPYDPSNQT